MPLVRFSVLSASVKHKKFLGLSFSLMGLTTLPLYSYYLEFQSDRFDNSATLFPHLARGLLGEGTTRTYSFHARLRPSYLFFVHIPESKSCIDVIHKIGGDRRQVQDPNSLHGPDCRPPDGVEDASHERRHDERDSLPLGAGQE